MRRLWFLLIMSLSAFAVAMWMAPSFHVPIARLIDNLGARLREKPRDPILTYQIGRLHSMALAEGEQEVYMYGTESAPVFSATRDIRVKRKERELTARDLEHLRLSLKYYHEAVNLDSKTGLPQLGLAWMLEEAAPFATQLGVLPWNPKALTKESLTAMALAHYRATYKNFLARDLKASGHLDGVANVYVSEDAGRAILRLEGSKLKADERREIEKNVKELSDKVMGITPIVFPMDSSLSLSEITDDSRTVRFDLRGIGRPQSWSWVRPNAGLLVWDPTHAGRITSGRQLFGSVTFWLFFADGYSALRSLDDNQDGWLTDRELSGLAVWCDRNGNGRCDPGEVVPVQRLGISAIRATPTYSRGVLSAADGIRFSDGRVRPSFDWIPTPR